MVMIGEDTQNNFIQRYDTTVTTTSQSKLQLELTESGSPTITAGETTDMNFTITNIGSPLTYTVSVSDSEGYFVSLHPTK